MGRGEDVFGARALPWVLLRIFGVLFGRGVVGFGFMALASIESAMAFVVEIANFVVDLELLMLLVFIFVVDIVLLADVTVFRSVVPVFVIFSETCAAAVVVIVVLEWGTIFAVVATSVLTRGTEILVSNASFFVFLELLIAVVFTFAVDEALLFLEVVAIFTVDFVEAEIVLDMLTTRVVMSGVVSCSVTLAGQALHPPHCSHSHLVSHLR